MSAALISAEARWLKRHPMLLARIHGLAAWSSPKLIIGLCKGLLERRDPGMNEIRLRGAIIYARWARRFGDREASEAA